MLDTRLVGAGRDCGDVASTGCVIIVAAFEPPALVSGFDDIAVMPIFYSCGGRTVQKPA
jgi:hypothetical protein